MRSTTTMIVAVIVVMALVATKAAAAAPLPSTPTTTTTTQTTTRLSELAGVWRGNWGTIVSGGATGAGNTFDDPTHTLDVTWAHDGTGTLTASGNTIRGTIACVAPDAAGGLITCTVRRSDGMVQGLTGVLKSPSEFVGSYVHFNVAGLFTTMYLRRVPQPQPPRHTVVACEGTRAHLACAAGTRLRVVDVLYGRDDTTTCPYPASSDPAFVRDNRCRFAGARDIVTRVCGLEERRGGAPAPQTTCTVEASNDAMGVDPCVNTYKYLRVTYECVAA